MVYGWYFDYKLIRYVTVEREREMNANYTSDTVTIKDGKLVWLI